MCERVTAIRAVGASVRGMSHEKGGQPCQDSHEYRIFPPDLLVGAVADGAGSAILGEVGARMAVRTAIESMSAAGPPTKSDDWESILRKALEASRTAIEAEAEARQVGVRDMATTLLLMVALEDVVASAQVGDGAMVAGDVDGKVHSLTIPQTGEYVNETTFLHCADAIERAQIKMWHGPVAHVAAFSDGLQMLALKMPEGAAHAPFFLPLFRFVAEAEDEKEAEAGLTSFLQGAKVRSRTDDDVTLLLAAFIRR